VAAGEPRGAFFAAVAQEVGRLLGAGDTLIGRYVREGADVVVAGGWNRAGGPATFGADARGLAALVFDTGRPSRSESEIAVACPISVDGRVWGVLVVASGDGEPLPADAETRLADFTDLVATAVANANAEAEVAATRLRLIARADQTRRRFERDLHEGAQQRLVVLALHLRTAIAAVPAELSELAQQLNHISSELDEALDDLREFARGIHPAILSEAGLAPALRSLARRSPVPVELDVRTDRRLPEPVEVAAYCVVAEALTNADKHAGASTVMVDLGAAADGVRVNVRDDGAGGAEFAAAGGLLALRDRVEALGGRMSLQSAPGAGTSLSVALPLAG
jgi:signal transduction histidine kinase